MRPIFTDPVVLLLAVGGEHPLRDHCRSVLAAAAAGRVQIHQSVEGGQEFLFHRSRMVGKESAVREFDHVERLVVWHAFDLAILHSARDLMARSEVRGRDAVHAATALAAGFTTLVSADRDFDAIPGLTRRDPRDVGDGW